MNSFCELITRLSARCIARIRRQMNRDNHSAQSEELQRKMCEKFILARSLQRACAILSSSPSASHLPCMYGIVGVVFIAFLVRFAFIAFLAYLNIGLSLSPFIRGANRCGELPAVRCSCCRVQPATDCGACMQTSASPKFAACTGGTPSPRSLKLLL